MSGGPGVRRVLITGASRGLGRALAEEMAERGHTVVACARSQGQLDDLRSTIGPRHRVAVVDVRDEAAVAAWMRDVLAEGTPDLAILGAGVANRNAPLWEVPADELRAVIDTAVPGTANVIRALVPAMASAGGGVIVAMSSGLGRSVAPQLAPYCAAKWAIEGMIGALARELPPGVTALTVEPGMIRTDMLRQYLGTGADAYPAADGWAAHAADFLLALDGRHNGQALSIGQRTSRESRGFAARAVSRLRGGSDR
jgi:NAD(P)-dependent dehydrogenase (short-subunit alcohol dehydrogenase family)